MKHVHEELYVGGVWRPPTGETRSATLVSPIDEEVAGVVPLASLPDVDDAVTAARSALRSGAWADLVHDERAALLERFADELEATAGDRAALTTVQNGMPIGLSNWAEGQGVVAVLRYYATLARTTPIEETRARVDGLGRTVVRRVPVGVVAAIVPWNFPQTLTMFKLAPALAAGCSVVIKPAPETVLDAFELAAAADRAGLPAGVLSVVTGGGDVGSYLVSHPGVDKVCFTGSTRTGRAIGELCGRLLRPVTLELGGKSAAIVLDDAHLPTVAQGLATSSLLNNGQTCYNATRILAPRSRYDEMVEAISALASGLTVGDPFLPGTDVGPVVSRQQRDRIESYIEIGKQTATLVAGGTRPDRAGFFVEPTVFADVDNDLAVAREEIFGPVLVVIPYRDLDEAVAIANDSEYGLGGTIWTTDTDKGVEIARRIETGTVGVNFYNLDIGAPFGGIKSSGLGRELGPEGLTSFQTLKSIYLGH